MQIYRYRPMGRPDWDGYVQDILTNGRLYFPSPAQLNDPFDPVRQSFRSAPPDELRPLVRRAVEDASPHLSAAEKKAAEEEILTPTFLARADQLVNDLLDRAGISCFSERSDEILMWSHYTNSHQGICVEFDKEILDLDWQKFHGIRRVSYTNTLPKFDPKLPDEERTVRLVLTKYSGWGYEREWRAIFVREKGLGSGLKNFPPDSLTGLIFGCKTTASYRDQIRDWVAAGPSKKVQFFEARMRALSFALDIVPCAP